MGAPPSPGALLARPKRSLSPRQHRRQRSAATPRPVRGRGTTKLRDGEGASHALASIRRYGRYGASHPLAATKRSLGGARSGRREHYIPDPPPSRSSAGARTSRARTKPRRRTTTSPRPAERPPLPHLELGLAGSASAPWNMVALSSSAPQPRSNRAVGRPAAPPCPAIGRFSCPS